MLCTTRIYRAAQLFSERTRDLAELLIYHDGYVGYPADHLVGYEVMRSVSMACEGERVILERSDEV